MESMKALTLFGQWENANVLVCWKFTEHFSFYRILFVPKTENNYTIVFVLCWNSRWWDTKFFGFQHFISWKWQCFSMLIVECCGPNKQQHNHSYKIIEVQQWLLSGTGNWNIYSFYSFLSCVFRLYHPFIVSFHFPFRPWANFIINLYLQLLFSELLQ